MTNKQNLKHFFAAITVISKKIEDFQKTTSDWIIINIVKMILKIAKYKPASGSSYIPLPEYISLKNVVSIFKMRIIDVLNILYYADFIIKKSKRIFSVRHYINLI